MDYILFANFWGIFQQNEQYLILYEELKSMKDSISTPMGPTSLNVEFLF